ncbi:protein of unknown function [Vibrio tapetis subsp. tapetis]|uniref:Uncharacterized protein n=1 Tax=Vibrio tapetis subsp. tapetis TaxID=1671868 RepID=A0A2N8ZN50_9VIBR|nr:protein of unknown function [Vibrio tapetis subsp. tapetis]
MNALLSNHSINSVFNRPNLNKQREQQHENTLLLNRCCTYHRPYFRASER